MPMKRQKLKRVDDSKGTTIPETNYSDFTSKNIIDQSRPKGDAIIEGITLKVKINATYEETTNDDTKNDE